MYEFESDIRYVNLKIGQTYYYVQSTFRNTVFTVMSAPWTGCPVDCMRLTKSNFFSDKERAENVCYLLNERYKLTLQEARIKFCSVDDEYNDLTE